MYYNPSTANMENTGLNFGGTKSIENTLSNINSLSSFVNDGNNLSNNQVNNSLSNSINSNNAINNRVPGNIGSNIVTSSNGNNILKAGHFDGWFDNFFGGQGGNDSYHNWIDGLSKMKNYDEFINEIMNKYKESPWAKNEINQSIQASNAAAAASGMLGSGAQSKELQDRARQISSYDQQKYLHSVLGVIDRYLGGERDAAGFDFRRKQYQDESDRAKESAFGSTIGGIGGLIEGAADL